VVNSGSGAEDSSSARSARKSVRPHRADPVNRLPYERNSEVNPAFLLRGEFLESSAPSAHADRAARRRSSGVTRDGISRESDRLIRDPEIPIELLEW